MGDSCWELGVAAALVLSHVHGMCMYEETRVVLTCDLCASLHMCRSRS